MSRPDDPDREELESVEDDPNLNLDVLRRRREVFLTVVALTLVLVVTLVAAQKFLRKAPTNTTEIAQAAFQAVREAMPGVAVQLGEPAEAELKEIADNHYQVSGRFLAVNGEGQSAYYVYTCSLEQPGGGKWRPVKLDITPMF